MRADIVPGGTFPDYELTDHTKTRRRLRSCQTRGAMSRRTWISGSTPIRSTTR
jgi:hypothetical protein